MQVDRSTAYKYKSNFLPIEWPNFYDSTSRVRRLPQELYGFNIISVPSYILKDKSSRESHSYKATKNFEINELIPSEIRKIIICRSINTIKMSRTKQESTKVSTYPMYGPPFTLTHHLKKNQSPQRRIIRTILVVIINPVVNRTYKNYPSNNKNSKIYIFIRSVLTIKI